MDYLTEQILDLLYTSSQVLKNIFAHPQIFTFLLDEKCL